MEVLHESRFSQAHLNLISEMPSDLGDPSPCAFPIPFLFKLELEEETCEMCAFLFLLTI